MLLTLKLMRHLFMYCGITAGLVSFIRIILKKWADGSLTHKPCFATFVASRSLHKVNTPFIKCPALHPPLKPSHSAHFHTSSTPDPPTHPFSPHPPFFPQPLSPSSVTFNDCEPQPFCGCHGAALTRSCTPFCSFLLILPHCCHFPPFFSCNFSLSLRQESTGLWQMLRRTVCGEGDRDSAPPTFCFFIKQWYAF